MNGSGSTAGKPMILLTGATGFLGAQVTRRLLTHAECSLIALVRGPQTQGTAETTKDAREAACHAYIARAWWDWPELISALGTRIKVLCGDVALTQLGLDADTYAALAQHVTHIIHLAADLRMDVPIHESRRTNVQGTANMLALANDADRDHGLARFVYVSTAYVCGNRRGCVDEGDLTDAYGFANVYEQSKYEGERLVSEASAKLRVTICRPGMIVGDSRTGEIKTFNTIYFPLRLYLTQQLKVIPVDPTLRLNIVPVDYVADAVVKLTFRPDAVGRTFHLTAPTAAQPQIGEVVDVVRQWACAKLNLRLATPRFVPVHANVMRWLPSAKTAKTSFRELLPYLTTHMQFQRDNTDSVLGPYALQWRDFLPRLLDYAAAKSFLHRSERTVYEQVMYRLESKHRPVALFDVIEGRVVARNSGDVRRDMLAAASALRSLGVQSGDRVAIVGLNSTRYLTLGVAIGLIGAVSVPLYYTSPPVDIDAILRASGSKLLLVGVPKLLERIKEIATDIPIVSFCREVCQGPDAAAMQVTLQTTEPVAKPVMTWDQFLAYGEQGAVSTPSTVGFDAVATLRYTSGTTAQPKGVIFQHAQLRWMAEVMVAVLPWRTRTTPAVYLSFLPMNHVVEGILAMYATYYLPAPISIYFLENFKELQRALPLVRPTIFFAVPRVYERLWNALRHNWLGAHYLAWHESLPKQVLRRILCGRLLGGAGLDRCGQLIVGSAPVSEQLLRNFHELGIEIHNAYGLTEAPLVALNRLGANHLGTVGELLPETQVKFAADGEVMVRGPQVTAGYYGADTAQPFAGEWLLTGDIGSFDSTGHLIIQGRKKELIATSYGKKINTGDIETRLRVIPGVAEAMVVGEARPYCAALLWGDVDAQPTGKPSAGITSAIGRAIAAMNTQLSHPEQVKRWVLLPNDLSIEGGDLTANLKLKRRNVSERFARVIDELYVGEGIGGIVTKGVQEA